MSYQLLILPRAHKELLKVPKTTQDKVINSIQNLANLPRPKGSLKLTGRDGWRIRVGDFRVIYQIDDANREVTVLNVGHRRDVYR